MTEADASPWKVLFKASSDAILVVRPGGVLEAMNGAAAALFDVVAKKAAGKPLSNFLQGIDLAEEKEQISAVATGSELPMLVEKHSTVIGGEPAFLLLILRQAGAGNVDSAHRIYVDQAGLVVDATATLLGWKASDLVGKSVNVLLPSWTGSLISPRKKIAARSRDGRLVAATCLEKRKKEVIELLLYEDATASSDDKTWQLVTDILSTTVDPTIVIGQLGEILLFNPAAEKTFGWKKNEVLGENVNILMPESERERHDGYLLRYAKRRETMGRNAFRSPVIGVRREVQAERKNGCRFTIELSLSETYLPGHEGHVFVGVIHDISADAASAKQRLELTKVFVANTSHELRTPLHAIIGLTENVRGEIRPLMEAVQTAGAGHAVALTRRHIDSMNVVQEDLSIVLQSSWQLLSLVNDLLDYSQLSKEDASFSLATCPVNMHIEANTALAVVKNMPNLLDAVELINDVSPDLPCVIADPRRLQQVLINVVTNAIKFTEEGSITIGATLEDIEEDGDERMVITVSDTGCGIPKSQLKFVFDAFSQAHGDESAQKGGTGLGLGIAKALVEKHGGQLLIDSTEGVGTTIRFDLEVTDEAATVDHADDLALLCDPNATDMSMNVAAKERAEAARRGSAFVLDGALMDDTLRTTRKLSSSVDGENSKRGRILVVDDNARNRHLLRRTLTANNYAVTEAANGAEGLQRWNVSREMDIPEAYIDVVLLDVMMPVMDGFTMLKELRKEAGADELPVIMLTAKSQAEDIVQGLALGANDYLTKPFNIYELIARVRTHQGLAQLGGAYRRFVPDEFVKLLSSDILELRVGMGSEMPMTVLFTDIRNFTSISESLSPAEVFEFINMIFKKVTPIVRRYNGVVDKFIGDCVMALFPGDVKDAVQAAVDIQQELTELRAMTAALRVPAVYMGAGIHRGTVMLGTVGDRDRMDTTAISDAVNLAARIESLTKQLGVDILVSAEVLAAIGEHTFTTRIVGSIAVKGRSGRTQLLEVLDAYPEEKKALRMAHAPALERAIADPASEESAAAFKRMAEAGDSVARFHMELSGDYTMRSK